MSASDTIRIVFREQRAVFVLVFLVTFAAIAAVTLRLPTEYRSTAILRVGPTSTLSGSSDSQEVQTLALSAVNLLGTPAVQAAVKRELRPTDREGLAAKMSFEAATGTQLVEVSATDELPARAQRLANTYAQTFVAERDSESHRTVRVQTELLQSRIAKYTARANALRKRTDEAAASKLAQTELALSGSRASYRQLQEGFQINGSGVSMAGEAALPVEPSGPRRKLYLVSGALFALLLAAGLALGRNAVDRRVRDPRDVERLLGAPVLAHVPDRARRFASRRAKALAHAAFNEAFEFLRAFVQLQRARDDVRVLAVTSSGPGEGKTTTVANLAVTLAAGGARVIAVDCDLHRPALAARLGVVPGTSGLAQILAGACELEKGLTPVPGSPSLSILTSGLVTPNGSALFSLADLGDLVRRLRDDADYVLIDAPPATVGAESVALSALADGVMVVADLKRSSQDDLPRVREQIVKSSGQIVGAVLNRASIGKAHGYYAAPVRGARSANGHGPVPVAENA